MDKPLTANMEMYLKTIYEIADEGADPRVKAIAERLGVRMPSVTGALENLQGRGLVSHDRYGDVRLTPRGRRIAREVKARNDLIHHFLLDVLRLPPAVASRDACVLEHVVSSTTLSRLSEFLEFVRSADCSATDAISHFSRWLDRGGTGACPACHAADGERRAS